MEIQICAFEIYYGNSNLCVQAK